MDKNPQVFQNTLHRRLGGVYQTLRPFEMTTVWIESLELLESGHQLTHYITDTYNVPFFFTNSPSIAPPSIKTAPIICKGSIASWRKNTENKTADSGSKYPQMATICTESFPIDEK